MSKFLFSVVLIIISSSAISIAFPKELIIKSGQYHLSEIEQNINFIDTLTLNNNIFYFDDPDKSLAIAYEAQLKHLTLGGEIMYLKARYNSTLGTGTIKSYRGTFLVKKYFNLYNEFKLFTGAGLGYQVTRLSHQSTTAIGYVLEFNAGVVYRYTNYGIFLEYKVVNARASIFDWYEDTINSSGNGLFLGLSYRFN